MTTAQKLQHLLDNRDDKKIVTLSQQYGKRVSSRYKLCNKSLSLVEALKPFMTDRIERTNRKLHIVNSALYLHSLRSI